MASFNEQRATGSLDEIGRRDHEITAEYRIFGPPGTGKTTNLTRQIRRAVDRYGSESILVTSFSRAAAAELAGRDLPISPDRVGTLHSHCWHALGGPEIRRGKCGRVERKRTRISRSRRRASRANSTAKNPLTTRRSAPDRATRNSSA